jgi:ATP-dependent DNA helicase RecQ
MGGRSLLANEAGQIVGRMASAFKPQISDARYTVAGIIIRYRSDSQTSDKRFAGRLKCDRWEVVVPAIEGL